MNSDINKLVGNARESFGKGAARKLRAAGQTPAVIYGRGLEPQHVSVDAHALSLIVRRPNAIIELDIDGKDQLVLVKDVQKEAVRQYVEHVDLLVVKKGETVLVEVPITVVGEPFPGNTFFQDLNTLAVNVPATSIPDSIEVSVEGLEDGAQILVKDIVLPEGASTEEDPELLVANVAEIRETAVEAEETEAAEAPAEGEDSAE